MTRSEQRRSTKRWSRRLGVSFDCSHNSSRISLLFQYFFVTFLGRRFQRNRRGKKKKLNKQKPTFPIILLCFLFFPFSSFIYFHSFFMSLSLAFFLSFSLSLSFSGRKNHQSHQNNRKSPKTPKSPKSRIFPKITENPIKIGVPKITISKIRKHYENRAE